MLRYGSLAFRPTPLLLWRQLRRNSITDACCLVLDLVIRGRVIVIDLGFLKVAPHISHERGGMMVSQVYYVVLTLEDVEA